MCIQPIHFLQPGMTALFKLTTQDIFMELGPSAYNKACPLSGHLGSVPGWLFSVTGSYLPECEVTNIQYETVTVAKS